MFWIVEYNNKIVINEKQIDFNYINKENIKYFYFLNEKSGIQYGIDVEKLVFFINNQIVDIKIRGSSPSLIQYKTASVQINSNVYKIYSWNIGVETYLSNEVHKYIMTIGNDERVILTATKKNLTSGKVDEKKIHLI